MSERPEKVDLTSAYRHCGAVTARHGRSYHLATRLLPPERRSAVYALYAFARVVDDVVDLPSPDGRGACELLDEIETALRAGLAGGPAQGPVLTALVDTVERYAIDPAYFRSFLRSMRSDVPGAPEHVAEYRSMPQLRDYMYGSASVIGLELLPVLGTVGPPEEAADAAAALGEAFQMTNFLRDVGEDLERGRIYLPGDELAAFGVDADLLRRCHRSGTVDRSVARALAHLIAHTRALYRRAEPGIALLDPRARACVRTAFRLYAQILDVIEASGYRVLDRRAVVPARRRIAIAVTHLPGTLQAR